MTDVGTSGYVQVPDDLPAVSDSALTVWVLHVWWSRGGPSSDATHAQLQRALGRPDTDDPGNLTRLHRELVAAGLIEAERVRINGQTRNRYTPLRRVRRGDRRGWVELPASTLVALAAGEIKPCHLAALVRWQITFREEEHWTPGSHWTALGVADRSAAWGQTIRTVRAHRSHLIECGFLDQRTQPGRAPLTGLPGQLPGGAELPEHVEIPRQKMSGHPGNECRVTPANDPGKKCRPLVPTPDVPLSSTGEDQNHPSVPVGTERTARTARGRTSAAPPRVKKFHLSKVRPTGQADDPLDGEAWFWHGLTPTKGAAPSPEAMRTLARLPRSWHDCPAWVRRELARRIDGAFRAVRPDAIVYAVDRYAATGPAALDLTGDAEVDGSRHIRALTAVLHQLVADARAGGCIACGHDHSDMLDALAGCACCDRTRPPAADPGPLWPGVGCASCGSDVATLRSDLPIPVLACDACMDSAIGAAA